jgi:hypothetical protein
MVIFQVQHVDFAFDQVNAECQAAIGSYAQAPCAFAVAGQSVDLLRWEDTQFFRVIHLVEKCKHLAELVYRIGRYTFRIVFFVELFQTLVNEAPYFHLIDCSLLLNTCQSVEVKTNSLDGICESHPYRNGGVKDWAPTFVSGMERPKQE